MSPQSLGSYEEAWLVPSSSLTSDLWLGLPIRHKRQVGKTPPRAGVRAGPNGHASSLRPQVIPWLGGLSLLQDPTSDAGPWWCEPRPNLLLGLAQQGGRQSRGTESLGATGSGEKHQARGTWPWRTEGVLGHHSLSQAGQRLAPLSSPLPSPSVLEAPPGFRWGELVHIAHLVVGLVAHGEGELVAQADLLLLGVGEEQDLGDR